MGDLIQDATGNDLTYRIIGAAMTVHNALGYGYKEEIYERALAVELARREISCVRQHRVEVSYEGQTVALFFLDLLVEGTVVVEVKAFGHQLTGDERAQVINYLKATQAPVGLLLNFGRRSLEYSRVLPGKAAVSSHVDRVGRDNVKRTP